MKKGKMFVLIAAVFLTTAFPIGVLAAEESMETEAIAESGVLEETEAAVGPEALVETEISIETEVLDETKETIETEVPEETEAIIEAEGSEETEETAETEVSEKIQEQEIIENAVYDKASDKYTNKDIYNFVVRMYDKFLDRSADSEGLDTWYKKLESHEMEAADIVDSFISSKEFQGKNLTTKEYLNTLYEGMLGRKPDSTGMKTWTTILDDGVSRKYISAQFVNSPEFIKLCDSYKVNKGDITLVENRDQNYDVTKFVSHFYNYCLDRSGDVKGLNDWTGWLLSKSMTGSDVAQGFLLSKEFIDKGLNDKEFIEILYRTLLSRTSDAEGMATWTACLENGVSNSYVLAGFAKSKEFSGLCDTYGIVRGDVKLVENRDQNYELTSLVNQLFKECLGYKPKGEELNHKLGQLFDGSLSAIDLTTEFFNSTFYQSKNKDAAAFVTDIYNLVLRRQPSTSEVNAGAERVAKGSKEEAIQRALLTKEFSEKCDSYHIELLNYSENPAMWYAKEILDQVGWDMAAAFRWSHTALRYSGVGTPPAGASHAQWYGKYGYENRKGNCYVMAATFYWMAKTVGWEAYFVEGYVPLARGGMGPHGWVEIVRDGTTYVCDPDFTYESGRNGYFITYGTSGTWRYSNYHRAD